MTNTLYAWKAPRVTDPDEAAALLERWGKAGEDAEGQPFEASTDVHWFFVELLNDLPELDAAPDEDHAHPTGKLWWTHETGPTDRLVTMKLHPGIPEDAMETIGALAVKYDLVLFDPQRRTVHLPMDEMAAYASATFWPRGAIQAFVAGVLGGLAAVVAWFLDVQIVSGIVAIVGAFVFVMAVYTFIHEGRKRMNSGRSGATGARRS